MIIEFLFLSLNPKLFTGKISISISGLFFLPKNAESLDDKILLREQTNLR